MEQSPPQRTGSRTFGDRRGEAEDSRLSEVSQAEKDRCSGLTRVWPVKRAGLARAGEGAGTCRPEALSVRKLGCDTGTGCGGPDRGLAGSVRPGDLEGDRGGGGCGGGLPVVTAPPCVPVTLSVSTTQNFCRFHCTKPRKYGLVLWVFCSPPLRLNHAGDTSQVARVGGWACSRQRARPFACGPRAGAPRSGIRAGSGGPPTGR